MNRTLIMTAAVVIAGCSSKGSTPKTAVGATEAVISGLNKDDVGVLWKSLPSSYQAQLTKVVHTGATKLDQDLYDKGMGLLARTAKVLDEKRTFVLGNAMVKMMMERSDVKGDEIGQAYDPMVRLLNTFLNSEFKTLDGLKSLDLGKFSRGTASKMMKSLRALMKNADDNPLANLKTAKVEAVSSKDGVEVVKTTLGEDVEEHSFAQVEGKWVPLELKESMEKMAEQTESVEKFEIKAADKAKALLMMGMVGSVLEQLEKAKTQEEFDGALAGIPGMGMMK